MPMFCNSAQIAENIQIIAKTQHIVVQDMLLALHIGKNKLAEMKRGAYPRIDTLARIAEYLGCTVNDLIYRGDDSPK